MNKPLLLSLSLSCGFPAWAQQAPAELTFFVISDTQIGAAPSVFWNGFNWPAITAAQSVAGNEKTANALNGLPGTAYPAAIGGSVAQPLGVIVAGDLTEAGLAQEWNEFVRIYGLNGGDGLLDYPVFEGAGNHDSPDQDDAIAARNLQRNNLSAISTNGLHYSWDWNDVHLVQLNRYAADIAMSDQEDPELALEFLECTLDEVVGDSGRPVILFQHYGWDEFSINDNWWSQDHRDDLFEAIEAYNVIAIFHGHSHVLDHTAVWNGIPTFDAGSIKEPARKDLASGDLLVVKIGADQLTVTARLSTKASPTATPSAWDWGPVWTSTISRGSVPDTPATPLRCAAEL